MRHSINMILTGALLGALGVLLGAFGAHALEARLPAGDIETFETAVRYQLWHALALLFAGLLAGHWPQARTGRLRAVGWLFGIGIVLFSGSLYALVLSGVRLLGMVTPLGGLCFIAGWTLLAYTAWRMRGESTLG